MISYEDWLQELVPINKQYALTREEYYKKFMPSFNPKDFYKQLLSCPSFVNYCSRGLTR